MHTGNDSRPGVRWPDGRTFAFTVFDDPDGQSVADGRVVYDFLADLGFRTTRGVWPGPVRRTPNSGGETCDSPEYRAHTLDLQAAGFEIGFHNTTRHSSTRAETIDGLDRFRDYFGHNPSAMANHYNEEAIYWGPARVTPPRRTLYQMATLGRTRGTHFGEVEGHPSFWGDICQARIRYCRNFVFRDINTLAACPSMPYHDPLKSYVQAWYASTEGSNFDSFVQSIAEEEQDRLEAEGGACIMYAHFGHRFVERGRLKPRFDALMKRLAAKNGWFAPVSVLLDHLRANGGTTQLRPDERRSLERRWLWEKLRHGTS
jgi:hypothetical protein